MRRNVLCWLPHLIRLKTGSGLRKTSRRFSGSLCRLFTSGGTRASDPEADASAVTCATSPTMYEPGSKTKRERWGIQRTCGHVRKLGRTARSLVSVMRAGAGEGAGSRAGSTRMARKNPRSSGPRRMLTGTGGLWRPTLRVGTTMTSTQARRCSATSASAGSNPGLSTRPPSCGTRPFTGSTSAQLSGTARSVPSSPRASRPGSGSSASVSSRRRYLPRSWSCKDPGSRCRRRSHQEEPCEITSGTGARLSGTGYPGAGRRDCYLPDRCSSRPLARIARASGFLWNEGRRAIRHRI